MADWQEAHKYLQLVVDGTWACAPELASELPGEPRFLPDVMTGGAPMSDQTFRELLKKPFTYHSHFGTRAGLLAAAE